MASIHRHKPAANSIAVRIEADDPDYDRPLRGWLVCSLTGRHQYIVNDDEGKAALGKAGVIAVISEPIKLTADVYMNLCAPF